jgi:hypothetical protein
VGAGARGITEATQIDEHFAAAFVNLAHLDERENDYQSAEKLLVKATPLDPSNADTFDAALPGSVSG